MPSFSPEQLAEVRSVDLLTFLMATAPDSLVKKGPHEWRTTEHGSLSISNGKWNWFAGGVGGKSALDYLIRVEHEPFQRAVERVTSAMQIPVPETLLRNYRNEDRIRKPFVLPAQSRSTHRVEEYLASRGIDRELVSLCIRQGILYESAEHHNVVFVGKDASGTPRFASLRGTYPGSKFRMDVEGSDKSCNFLFVPPGCDVTQVRSVAIFEAPIDALSFVAMNQRYAICPQEPWYDLPCLSCSGTAHAPVLQFLRDHPRIEKVMICFDNDEAGRKGVVRISQNIRDAPDLARQIKELCSGLPPPDRGKDWNEVLVRMLPQPEEREPIRSTQRTQSQEVI